MSARDLHSGAPAGRAPPGSATPDRDAVLDAQQLAQVLGVGRRKVEQLDLPCFWVGKRPRWILGPGNRRAGVALQRAAPAPVTGMTLVIDRAFRGVGRIKRATGTTRESVRRRISDMLTALHQDGRLDLLRAIRDGQITMLEVYDAHRRRKWRSCPSVSCYVLWLTQ